MRVDIKRVRARTLAGCVAAVAMLATGCASYRAVSCKGRLEPINAPAASATPAAPARETAGAKVLTRSDSP